MATRRMIHNKISRSEQVNNLSYEAALLYTWMITHADDDGRLKGSSASVRATVFPMKELKNEDVEKMLNEIEEQGLIWRWQDNNGCYIEIPTWFQHQTLQKDRVKPSVLPSYNDHVSELETTNIQIASNLETQDKVIEDNESKGNKEENNLWERESEGKPTLNSNFTPSSFAEHAAMRAWNLFDNGNQELLESRYLKAVRSGISASILISLTNDLTKNHEIENKGKEFEKRVKSYIKHKST